jgi:hypothetical protein
VAAPADAVRQPHCPAPPAAPFYLSRCHTHVDARKHTLHGDAARCSSHKSSHGSQAGTAGSVTVSDGDF